MPVPVFEQLNASDQKQPDDVAPGKPRYTGPAIFFTILMVIVMVIFGEFAFRDSSRLFNPYYKNCQTKSGTSFLSIGKAARIPASCQLERYERTRLILHADIVAPIALVTLILYAIARKRVESSQFRLMLLSLYIFAGWMVVRALGETEYFLLKHHPLYGRYIVLVTIVVLLAILISIVQKRANKKVIS